MPRKPNGDELVVDVLGGKGFIDGNVYRTPVTHDRCRSQRETRQSSVRLFAITDFQGRHHHRPANIATIGSRRDRAPDIAGTAGRMR
jgi:hypothetical protein